MISASHDSVKLLLRAMDETFGHWLQRRLDRRGWRQADMVRALGVSRSAVEALDTLYRGAKAKNIVKNVSDENSPHENSREDAGI